MLNKNLQVLKKEYPELYSAIEEYRSSVPFKYEHVLSKNNMNNLMLDNNLYLHSRYNPLNEASSWIASIDLQNNEDSIVIIGFGLGYYLEMLAEKYRDKKIIIIEPDLEIFIHAITYSDMSKYLKNDNIVFIVGKEPIIVANLLQYYLENNKIKNFYIAELPIYKRLFKEYVIDIYEYVNAVIMRISGNIHTDLLSARRWLYNVLRNIRYISNHHNIASLKNYLQNIPVVIVSAGPSLEKQLPLLKKINNKALIIAVGSAANILDSHNIDPHIIMAVDGNPSEARIFRNLNNHRPLLLYNHILHYEILNQYKGKKMWFALEGYEYTKKLFGDLDIETPWLLSGPSIANIALGFADWLEAPSIMLIGQDLAYTNMVLYAQGSVHQQVISDELIKQKGYVVRKDIYGNDVYTKMAFLSFKSWFEDYVIIRSRKGGIYNCTEGGLPIEGIPNTTFEEAVSKYCVNEYDIPNLIENCLKQELNIDANKLEEFLSNLKEDTEKICELSAKRLDIVDELLKDVSRKDYNKKFDKVLSIGEEIEEYDVFHKLIYFTGKSYLNAITSGIKEMAEKEESIVNKRKVLLQGLANQYRFIHENIQVILKAIDEEEVSGLFE